MADSKYAVLDLVGQGQYGQVYKGMDCRTGERVALKHLDEGQLNIPRFLHELNLLASLQHPHIAAFRGLDYIDGHRYLVMDYYEGGTLRDLLEATGSLEVGQCLTLVMQILQGVSAIHAQGIVHCDLKPDNILLSGVPEQLQAHVSDFGVARFFNQPYSGQSQHGDTGSTAYMAPERFYGDYSPASDLYAMGIMLLELLVGERPFVGLPGEVMSAHLNQAVSIPDHLPFQVQSILKRSLQKLPQNRYPSAEQMLAAIQVAHTTVMATV